MAKQETRVSATITFKADKMLARMKKCLNRKGGKEFMKYPAVEIETGLLVATDGFVLAAHKLREYHCEQSENAVLGAVIVLPVEALAMKGMVTVVVTNNEFHTITTATDEKGAKAQAFWCFRYPAWRSVFPWITGWPIDIDAKAWDTAVKELQPKIEKHGDVQPIHLYADEKSTTLKFSYDNDYPDGQGSTTVAIDEMPYRMGVGFNAIHLRDVLAFEPNTLRFTDNTRAVIFHNDETLMLLMPLNIDVDGKPMCEVPKRERTEFGIEKWEGNQPSLKVQGSDYTVKSDGRSVTFGSYIPGALAETQPSAIEHQPSAMTLAEQLRQALLKRLAA